jgi:hypothetical protein
MCECKKNNTEAAIAYVKEKFEGKLQVSDKAAGLVNETPLSIHSAHTVAKSW